MTIHHLRKVTADPRWCQAYKVYWRFHLLVNGESCYPKEWFLHRLISKDSAGSSRDPEFAHAAPDLPQCHIRRCQFGMETNSRMLSVSECWNEGVATAFSEGCHLVIIMANDVIPEPGCLPAMVEFMAKNRTVDIASGIATNLHKVPDDDDRVSAGCDFSCFVLKRKTVEKFGYFDPNYRVAYFEDNDYMARIWAGGGQAAVVHAARFNHVGSQTIAKDPEQATHVRAWFERNRAYFVQKWGCEPIDDPAQARAKYYKNPFNDVGKSIGWNPPVEE